jgi:hypothetical protein
MHSTHLGACRIFRAKVEYSKLEKWLLPTDWHKDALLGWRQPQKAWRILEARWFSFKRILVGIVLAYFVGLLLFQLFDLFAKEPVPVHIKFLFPLFISISSIAIASMTWWYAPVLMKISNTAVTRLIWNDSKCWTFPNIGSYSFEHLSSESQSYTFFVLRKKNGRTWKIALDDSINKTKLEEILVEHGIPKLEQPT